ncbi:uncharacterized protein PWA37_001582 [Arxiozyma heterogenica]
METDDFQQLSSDILRKCSSLALNMNMLPMTFSLLSKLLSYDSVDIRNILLLGNAYLKNRNYINVIHLLMDAINSKMDYIVNDYRLWKQLAFAYYKLNKYDDAHHAIAQALSSVSSPRLAYERQQANLEYTSSSYAKKFIKGNINTTFNSFNPNTTTNSIPGNVGNDELNTKSTNNTNINNNTTISNDENNTSKHIIPYTVLLPKKEEETLKYKIFVLNCRISLLASEKTHSISLLLSDFQMALSQIDFHKNTSLYLEVLITRAQMFRKYNVVDKCRQDLIQCLTILNENKARFKREDLSHKVAYCYYFLITVEFLHNSDFELALKLIKEVHTNFQLPAFYLQKFLILEAYIRTIHNPKDGKNFVERLKMEIPIITDTVKPKFFYALGRLVLQNSTDEDIETTYNYYQDALSIIPTDPIIWISIASLYFDLCQYEDALSTYLQAAGLASSSEILQSCSIFEVKFYKKFAALAWFGISQVYCATNQINNAISAINEAINIFRMEKDKMHINELETIKGRLQDSQIKYRRLKESRTVQEIINSEEGLSDSEKSSSSTSKKNVKIDYTIPDVPFELLTEFETYQDQQVFTCEYELDPVNITDPELDIIIDNIQMSQSQHTPVIVSNNISQLVDTNANSYPYGLGYRPLNYTENTVTYGAPINTIQLVPNQVFFPTMCPDSKNTGFENTTISDPEAYPDANKFMIIPQEKQNGKMSFITHIDHPLTADVSNENTIERYNTITNNNSPMM